MKKSSKLVFKPQGKKILVVSAHPDDLDFNCGGSLIRWIKAGAKAALVVCTNGDKGSSDRSLTSTQLAKIRHTEQLAASKFLGLDQTWFLDYADGHLEVTQKLKEQLVKIIRDYKPDALLTFDPTMVYSRVRNYINHPDHRAVGQAALDAIFPMARDFLTFPQHAEQGLLPHKVLDILLYNFDTPNYFIDISEVFDQKLQLMATHESQIDLATVEPLMRDWNGQNGKAIGAQYAESFVYLSIK